MRSKRIINVIALVIGIGALSYLIYKVGLDELLDNLLAVGPVFPLLLLIEAASTAFSTFGWLFAFEPSSRPSYTKLLGINFASLSIAGALPTGQAGEVAKGNLLRGEAPAAQIVSSLLIYNYLHVMSVMLMVLVGPLAALAVGGDFDANVIWICLGAGVLVLILVILLGLLLYSGIMHKVLDWIGRHRLLWKPSQKLKSSVGEVDGKLRDIIASRPSDLFKGYVGLILGRFMRILEVYVILSYLDVSGSLVVALMVFSATAMVNYLLMVLPAREGFLEGSTYVVFKLLGMNGAHGLSMEIIRRLRKIFFQITGVLLMMYFVRKKDVPAQPDPPEAGKE